MKRNFLILASGMAVLILACAVLAQDSPSSKPAITRERAAQARRASWLNDAAKSSDILGMTVRNYQDEKLGLVKDLAVDLESGRIIQVIMSSGGWVGIGERMTALPPGALHRDSAHQVLRLDADQAKLKSAPAFDLEHWEKYSDSAHLLEVYRHFGEEPAFGFMQSNEAVLEAPHNADGSPNTVSTQLADGTWVKGRDTNAPQPRMAVARLSHVLKARDLAGWQVQNLEKENLGLVENLLLDLPSGRVIAVVIASGGFLGMEDELSAIPPTTFRILTEARTLQLDISKAQLTAAPHFNTAKWPDFAQPGYAGGVYRAYRVTPYFTLSQNN